MRSMMKFKWVAILAALFALTGAVTVMSSCDRDGNLNTPY